MTTLSDLRALLERAIALTDNPAILRLPEGERTVEGVARAYLPRWVSPVERRYVQALPVAELVGDEDDMKSSDGRIALRLTDPGTAHALLVELALALGLDPGVGGLSVSWTRRTVGDSYILCAPTGNWLFDVIEPDPIKALCLAVRHVLEMT